jgi:hypothetical protein
LSDSEFLPVWKKYPGVADTMTKAKKSPTLAKDAPRYERGKLCVQHGTAAFV